MNPEHLYVSFDFDTRMTTSLSTSRICDQKYHDHTNNDASLNQTQTQTLTNNRLTLEKSTLMTMQYTEFPTFRDHKADDNFKSHTEETDIRLPVLPVREEKEIYELAKIVTSQRDNDLVLLSPPQPVKQKSNMKISQFVTLLIAPQAFFYQTFRNLYHSFRSIGQRFFNFLHSIRDIDSKLIVFRAFSQTLLVLTIILIQSGLIVDEEIKASVFFALAYCYLTFRIFEDLVRVACIGRASWKNWDDGFDAIECIFGIILLIFWQNNISYGQIFVALLPILLSVLYILLADIPTVGKYMKLIFQIYYAIQGRLILTNTGGLFWIYYFAPTWTFLAINLARAFTFYPHITMHRLFLFLKSWYSSGFFDRDYLRQAATTFWYMLYENLSIVLGIFVYKLCEEEGSSNRYDAGFIYSVVSCSVMLIYTIVIRKTLVKYAANLDVVSLIIIAALRQNPQNQQAEEPGLTITLQPEEGRKLFLRCSSTFFVPFKPGSKRDQAIKAAYKGQAGQSPADRMSLGCVDVKAPVKLNNVFSIQEVQVSSPVQATIPNLRKDLEAKSDQEELCCICFSNKPDAILMECGHSGICYDCGVVLVKERGECMQCRATVQKIIQIDLEPLMRDVFRSMKCSVVVLNSEGTKR